MAVFFPDNPVARESVLRYVEAMKSVCVRASEGRGALTPSHNGIHNGTHAQPHLDLKGVKVTF
jgi:hypothetical protein